jgi:hypothetical protein
MARQVYWQGKAPDRCDLCQRKIVDEFVDGAVFQPQTNLEKALGVPRKQGPWAHMHVDCHRTHGVGLGVGAGQQYKLQDDGRWMKVAG